jgi:hypothetical protein
MIRTFYIENTSNQIPKIYKRYYHHQTIIGTSPPRYSNKYSTVSTLRLREDAGYGIARCMTEIRAKRDYRLSIDNAIDRKFSLT